MQRNQSLDAYRGCAMLLMMAEVLHLAQVAKAFPDSRIWGFLAAQQTHVAWAGCSLHDMIQPSFSFLVGTALPYSLAARAAAGQPERRLIMHALWRSFLLVGMGIFLRSLNRPMTNFTFDDTLTQIGLGYPFLFLLGLRPQKWAWVWLGIILGGCWLAWMLYPLAVTGSVAEAWVKQKNLGGAFDLWWMNLFPRPEPFTGHRGGYTTLVSYGLNDLDKNAAVHQAVEEAGLRLVSSTGLDQFSGEVGTGHSQRPMKKFRAAGHS